ncbi:MAG: NAD-dependent epimerase/dehydratase family protein [Candidatus Phosphoribacter sp.]
MSADHVVVTGGAGFIGGTVVSELLHRGLEVSVIDSLRRDVHRDGGRAGRERLRGLAVRAVEADVRDLDAARNALRGASAVVHLAAKVGLGVDIDDVDDYVSSNDLGTAVVLRACAAEDVPRVVVASSMVVYGEGRYTCAAHGVVHPGPRTREALVRGSFDPLCPVCGQVLVSGLVDEDARLDPRNVYAATKVAQEHLAAAWARETGGTAASLRFHNVYGAGMPRDTPYAGVAAKFLSALDRGEAPTVFEDGCQRRDFVHVSDVARAVAAGLGAGLTGHRAFNVGSGVVSTIGDVARALSLMRSGPEPVVTGEFRLGDVRHITASSERAADELGWRAQVGLSEGVKGLTT